MELPAVTGTLDIYIGEINRHPLLTAEEEFKLAGAQNHAGIGAGKLAGCASFRWLFLLLD